MLKNPTFIACFLGAGFIGYLLGIMNNKTETIETVIYEYDIEPGKNGILSFNVDQDSLAHVRFVQDGDTFALDALNRSEFDSLVNELYKDTLQ